MKTETGLFLFRNGKVYDAQNRTFKNADVIVENEKIREVGKVEIDMFRGKQIDIDGKYMLPGLIDMHVHLREPGREDEETIVSGTNAAMSGGFTAVCCMPNTDPPIDNRGNIEFIKKRARNLLVDVFPVGAVTKGRAGKELTEMGDMVDAEAIAFSDDGVPVANAEMLRYALYYSKMFRMPIIDHCEEQSMVEGKKMNEGDVSALLGIPAAPPLAEDLIVMRDIMMAEFTGGHIHIAHVSSGSAVAMIREAKKKGINVTAEACPHHFILTDEDVKSFDTNLRVNPPLRSKRDKEAVLEGIKDGTIDAIASDHAPHSIEEKDVEFDAAPPGMIGLETTLGLVTTFLLKQGHINLEKLVELMAVSPRSILNIPVPTIASGYEANFTVLDLDQEWKVDKPKFRSKSRNTPFDGWELSGKSFGVFRQAQWYQSEQHDISAAISNGR